MKHKFALRNHVDKSGKSLLYLHVWQNCPPKRIATDIYIEKKHWNPKERKVNKHCPNAENINLQIAQLEAKITAIKIRFALSETFMTIEMFLEEYTNGIPRTDFVTYFNYALTREKECMHPNTFKKQKSVYKILVEFRPKITFSEINLDLIRKFKFWRMANGAQTTTVNSNVAVIKKFLNMAKADGIKFALETKTVKVGTTNGNRDFLHPDEFNKFRTYLESTFLKPNLRQTLALFVFSCFTSIRISDALLLNPKYILNGSLKFTAVKTGKAHRIKLTAAAQKIIDFFPEILQPKPTDVDINRKLKEICNILGIKKKVTFHYGRHTFATNYLREKGTVQSLQKILGHASIKETMIYVHVLQEQLDEEIMFLDNIKITKDSQSLQ